MSKGFKIALVAVIGVLAVKQLSPWFPSTFRKKVNDALGFKFMTGF